MPVSTTVYGSLWYVLDERVGLRFSGIDLGNFGRTDLQRYNVLVFPPAYGGAGAYRNALGEQGLTTLEGWIEGGGTVIGIGGGAQFLADTGSELTTTRLRRQAVADYPPVVLGAAATAVHAAAPMQALGWSGAVENETSATPSVEIPPVLGAGARPFAPGAPTPALTPVGLEEWIKPVLPANRSKPSEDDAAAVDARLRSFAPRGTLVRVDMAKRHWMSWGLPEQIAVLLSASDTLVAGSDVDVVARFSDPELLHLGGLLWPEAAGRLAHTGYATRERKGDGQVILFIDDPTYRAWTLDTQRMFLNALLYGPGLGASWPVPW
jgi:hypothetical protein